MILKKVALIREAECIGCTKCIDACPTDAILGSAKHMHTVITAECIGCKLCVLPCPVDCIDILTFDAVKPDHTLRKQQIEHIKHRFHARKNRLQEKKENSIAAYSLDKQKLYITEAIAREKVKKTKFINS